MVPWNVAKCPPQEEGGTNNGEAISRLVGKSKKAFLVLGGKRRETDTFNVRCQCPCVYPSPHLDSNVKMGEDGREKLPFL